MPKITQRLVGSLKPLDKRYSRSGGGLVVEVNPSGHVVFFASFREGGLRHKVKLGDHPSLLVTEAQKMVLDMQHRRQIKGKRAVQSSLTFAEFAIDKHIEENFRIWCQANRKDWASSLKRIDTQFVAKNNPIGRTKLKDVTPAQIEAYKLRALEKNSPATVKRHLVDLRRVFSLATEWELIHTNPASRVKNPKVDTKAKRRLMLENPELKRLTLAVDKWRDRGSIFSPHPKRRFYPVYLPAMIYLALHLGLRKTEIMTLTFADWDVENKMIHIRGEKSKSGLSRHLDMTEIVVDCVRDWMKKRVEDFTSIVHQNQIDGAGEPNFHLIVSDHMDEYIFPIRDPKRSWVSFRKLANLEHIDFHTLRHDFASRLVLNGESLTVVRDLMGHRDIQTTNVYLSALDSQKKEALHSHSIHLQQITDSILDGTY